MGATAMRSCKFHGTLDDLQTLVGATDIPGVWRELLDGHYQFRTRQGAVLNWWSSTQTVHFQGAPCAVKGLQKALSDTLKGYPSKNALRVLSPL